MILLLISVLVVVIAILVATALVSEKGDEKIKSRLTGEKEVLSEEELAAKKKAPLTAMLIGFCRAGGGWVSRLKWEFLEERREKIQLQLNRAGKSHVLTPDDFIATQLLLAVIVLIIIPLLISSNAVIILIATALGFFGPVLWINAAVKKRHKTIFLALPDMLDLITMAIEAGLDFSAAINRIIEKSEKNLLVKEFERMQKEVSVGKSREQSLRDMDERIQHPALTSVINALVQAIKLGSSIGPIIRQQAEEMRVERFQQAEKIAAEAPLKMLFPLLFFIFPTIFIVIFGPMVLAFLQQGGF